jgi:TonB family protein
MDSAGIVVEAGGMLMHRNPINYPRGANVTGTVVIDATLNQKGEVVDARVLSGPNELRRSALESVLGWHYATDTSAPPSVQISIHFNQAPLENRKSANPPPAAVRGGAGLGTIRDIQFSGITPDLERQLRQRIGVQPGDLLNSDTMGRISAAAHSIDEHIIVSLSRETRNPDDTGFTIVRLSLGPQVPTAVTRVGVTGGVTGGVPGGVVGGVEGIPPPPPPAPAGIVTLEGGQRVRVGGQVAAANLVRRVVPAYPPQAKENRIQGTVRFNVTIAADGSVKEVQLISGHPLFVPVATDAVKQWLYKPTLLNGAPVEVITTIDVNFTLSQEL